MARKTPTPAKAAKPSPRDGRYLATAREAKTSWEDILAATGAKSAIPLRVVLRRFLLADAKNEARYPVEYAKVAKYAPTAKNVVAARDLRGEGFPLIASRTGLSVAKVRELYAKGNGLSADGRVYVGSAGRTLVTASGSTPVEEKAAKPRKRASKATAKVAPAKAATSPAKAAKRGSKR